MTLELNKLHTVLLIVLMLSCAGSLNADNSNTEVTDSHRLHNSDKKTQRFALIDQLRYPNGITHGPNGALYIGSVTSGNVFQRDPDGTMHKIFSETDKVFAGTSLRFDSTTGILWVTSPDFLGKKLPDGSTSYRPSQLAAIDLSTKKVVGLWTIPDKGLGNDIALDGFGGVYVTDSINDRVYHLDSAAAALSVFTEHKLFQPGKLGPAGIARLFNGDLIIGLFSQGHLLRVALPTEDGAPVVTRLKLERKLQNPDGIRTLPDGRIVVLEGAVASGNGKVVVIDTASASPHPVTELAQGLDSPLNLTVSSGEIYITEGRIRHLMVKDAGIPAPNLFYLRQLSFDAPSLSTQPLAKEY